MEPIPSFPYTRLIAASVASSAVTALLVTSLAPRLSPPAPTIPSGTSTAEDAPVPTEQSESVVVRAVETAEPSVVSVIISKDVPVIERSLEESPFGFRIPRYTQNGTEQRQIGGGTAFFVREDGLLMTNRHVVDDPDATYTVFLHDGRTLTATVAAVDPSTDIALLKVDGNGFPALTLSNQQPALGQSVVAIGNALAEFRNTVSVGVVSGLGRSIIAGGLQGGVTEELNAIIQTDAAINEGNSGGPLVDLRGRVVGMNTAVAGGAQNIAFAIPAEQLQRALESYARYQRIVRPYMGVRYVPVTAQIQQDRSLTQKGGALVTSDVPSEPAVVHQSPAAKAGLREGDHILEVDGENITAESTLASLLQRRLPGDEVVLTIVRAGKDLTLTVTLEEWNESGSASSQG